MNLHPGDGLPSATRRRLCQLVGAFFLGPTLLPGTALAAPGSTEQRTLDAFLDTLFPRDEDTGSAAEFGISRQLWAFAATEPNFRRLVGLGCQWLNLTGGMPFAKLDAEQRTALVRWMADADWNEIPRRFYELVRQVGIELYYSQPSAAAGLPLQRSPQPTGYPPPWA